MNQLTPQVTTPHLDLIAATDVLARADAGDPARLSELLRCETPAAWPPEVMRDVRDYFAQQLEKDNALTGWWNWYAIQKSPRVLVGCGGFNGPPDSEGSATLGYSVVSGYEGKGFASELAAGLLQWAEATGRVKRVFATTFERHLASVRVLEKNGFACRGVSSEDAGASETDRQGRGPLMVYVRTFR